MPQGELVSQPRQILSNSIFHPQESEACVVTLKWFPTRSLAVDFAQSRLSYGFVSMCARISPSDFALFSSSLAVCLSVCLSTSTLLFLAASLHTVVS